MKDGTEERNDRLIAVPVASRRHQRIRSLEELPEQLLLEMEHFFVSYNQLRDKQFVPQGRFGPERALEVVKRGVASAKRGTAQR